MKLTLSTIACLCFTKADTTYTNKKKTAMINAAYTDNTLAPCNAYHSIPATNGGSTRKNGAVSQKYTLPARHGCMLVKVQYIFKIPRYVIGEGEALAEPTKQSQIAKSI